MSRDWWSPGQRWLEQEALKESASQRRAWVKSGRSANTFRYNPPQWHRNAVEALGRNDEETFKAIKLEQIGLPPLTSAKSFRHHATKTPTAQLKREIAEVLAQRPGEEKRAHYYIAHPDEVAEVTILFHGLGDYNVKRRYKKPVRVRNVSDGDEFFVEESEIFRDPIAAGVRSAELARKALGVREDHSSLHHSTRKGLDRNIIVRPTSSRWPGGVKVRVVKFGAGVRQGVRSCLPIGALAVMHPDAGEKRPDGTVSVHEDELRDTAD